MTLKQSSAGRTCPCRHGRGEAEQSRPEAADHHEVRVHAVHEPGYARPIELPTAWIADSAPGSPGPR